MKKYRVTLRVGFETKLEAQAATPAAAYKKMTDYYVEELATNLRLKLPPNLESCLRNKLSPTIMSVTELNGSED